MYYKQDFVGCAHTKLQDTGEITYCRFTSYAPHFWRCFSKIFNITL